MADISVARDALLKRFETLDDKAAILKAPELRELFMAIREQPEDQRREFGGAGLARYVSRNSEHQCEFRWRYREYWSVCQSRPQSDFFAPVV